MPGVRVRTVAAAAGLLGTLGYVFTVDPGQPGHYLPCPTYALSGTYCPGCGGLRSMHALLHGDLASSFGFHPLVPVAVAAFMVWGALWVRRGRPPLRVDPTGWGFRLALGGTLAFWILRNVPGMTWLSPL